MTIAPIPPPFTEAMARVDRIRLAAQAGCSDADIAALVGVEPSFLEGRRIAAIVTKARAEMALRVGAALLRKALAGNVPAATLWLKARHGWRDTEAAIEREEAARRNRTPRVLVLDDADDPLPADAREVEAQVRTPAP